MGCSDSNPGTLLARCWVEAPCGYFIGVETHTNWGIALADFLLYYVYTRRGTAPDGVRHVEGVALRERYRKD